MTRRQILTEVKAILETITIANGYSIDPTLIQYGDGTPSDYDREGVEINYLIQSRSLSISNKRWDWQGMLEIIAIIYQDNTGDIELGVESDILQAIGKNQTLNGTARVVFPSETEFTTEREVAGKDITLLTLNLPIKYSTGSWQA